MNMIDPQGDPAVSVVIPAYNHASFIVDAVDSALGQGIESIEVLVIDDGSTDHSAAVMERYENERRVRYLRQKNAGASVARNRGIEEARGEFIAFLDADDLWEAQKLQMQLALFSDPSVGVVYTGRSLINEKGEPVSGGRNRFYRGDVLRHLFVDNFICFSSVVIRRKCFEQVGRFDENLNVCIDFDLLLRMSVHCRFDYVSRPMVRYRSGHEQISLNKEGRYINTFKVREKVLALPEVREKMPLHLPRMATAKTFTNRGEFFLADDRRLSAMQFYIMAIFKYPLYLRAWKNIFTLFVPEGIKAGARRIYRRNPRPDLF